MSAVVKKLLIQLETELKQQQLWSAVPPDNAAMASTMPFCCDTMLLEQWLQFIFQPRIGALIEAQQTLPKKIKILPIAEEAFKPYGKRCWSLLQIIQQIDTTLADGA